MTPSAGGRNPFEAYLVARDVEGLPPGVYHYSALESSLGLVAPAPLPAVHELVGGTRWQDGGAAVIVLVAQFQRTAWKYSHPNAYRNFFIEAGHIGQNIMIAATARGLTAGPTAAFHDAAVERLLGLDRITQAATYALVIGEPLPVRPPRGALDRLARLSEIHARGSAWHIRGESALRCAAFHLHGGVAPAVVGVIAAASACAACIQQMCGESDPASCL